MDEKFYALICFLVLTDHFSTKHWSYIDEKQHMLNAGLSAFGYLDYKNMGSVIDYLTQQKLEVPKVWADEYRLQMDALNDLRARGLDF